MIRLYKKIISVLMIIGLSIILFSCKESAVSKNHDVDETEKESEMEIIKSIDISDVNNENERNTLVRIDNLNQTLGKDIYVSKEDYYAYRDASVLLIGDSIADGAKSSITKYFKKIMIDSVPGREIKKVLEVYNNMAAYKKVGDIVIISLGTNASDGIPLDLLEKVYEKLDGRPLFMLSIVIPYKGQERNRNREILKFINSHEDVYLIDYHKIMKPRPELFNDDRIHPNGAGGEVYAQMLFKAVADYLKTR